MASRSAADSFCPSPDCATVVNPAQQGSGAYTVDLYGVVRDVPVKFITYCVRLVWPVKCVWLSINPGMHVLRRQIHHPGSRTAR